MALELDEEDFALLGYGEVHEASEDFVFEKNLRQIAARNKWLKNNPEKATEAKERWRKNNPERVKEIRKRSYERTKKAYLARSKAWAKANPEKRAEINRRYHAKKKRLQHKD